MPLPFLDVLLPVLPTNIRLQIANQDQSLLDELVRFIASLYSSHSTTATALDALLSSKRKRSPSPSSPEKRLKSTTDPPLYTLHAISISAPLRKKLDITIHANSLHIPSLSPIPLPSFTRAFLLPTRGKQRPHWTVLLMSTDAPTPKLKPKEKPPPDTQIIFGIDAVPTVPFTITDHITPSAPPTTYPKSTPTLPVLLAFLSHLPITPHQPTPSFFHSARDPLDPAIDACRGARQGSLYFFPTGILWTDARPAEFWALEHIVPRDGLVVLSPTGRMGTILLRRLLPSSDDVEETEFGTVDGRELDGIREWARVHAPLFGKQQTRLQAQASPTNGESSNTRTSTVSPKPKPKPPVDGEDVLDSDTDPEDEDFATDSDLDSDRVSSGSSNTGGEGDGDSDAEVEAEGSAEEDVGDGDGDSERSHSDEDSNGDADLDPAHHPLLRPGAMPKISRAAIDTVVGMVERDFAGGDTRVADADEDEEDELDDWS